MPNFFLPPIADPEEAERHYGEIRKSIAAQVARPLEERRIFRLDYRHDGRDHFAQVGEPESGVRDVVVAIFKQSDYPLYYVCTPNRGILRGGPILVGAHDVRSFQDFD